jgi:hypothetical protein
MQVTVINHKLERSTITSATDAARMVGVRYITVLRWSYKSKSHQFNHFTIYFDTQVKKQPKGKHLKCYAYV